MIPGLTTKLSETQLSLGTTIYPKADLIHVIDTTTTTVLETITPAFGGGFSGIHVIVNLSGNSITTVTTGNIATAITIGVNVAVVLAYSKITNTFYVGALA